MSYRLITRMPLYRRGLRPAGLAVVAGAAGILAFTSAVSAQSLNSLDVSGFTVLAPPNADALASPGEPLRICAPPVGGLPGGYSYLHPPVAEVARALQINLCHAALVDPADVDGVMADANGLGLALNVSGDTALASAPPPLPPLGAGAPPPLPPIGSPAPPPLTQPPLAPPPLAQPPIAQPGFNQPPPLNSPPINAPVMNAPPIAAAPQPDFAAAPALPATNAPMALPNTLPADLLPIAASAASDDAQEIFKIAYDDLINGDPSASALQFVRGLQIDPSDGLAHYYLGVAYERLGRTDYAAIQYRRVADGWPETQHGARAAARMNEMVDGFAPRPTVTRADKDFVRPVRVRRPRIRSIEEIFKGSEGAAIMASMKREEKRKARDRRRAKAIAAKPARSPALVRVAQSGIVESGGRTRVRTPAFGGGFGGPGAGRVGTFADQPAPRLAPQPAAPVPVQPRVQAAPAAVPPVETAPGFESGPPPLAPPPLAPPPLTQAPLAPPPAAPALEAPIANAPGLPPLGPPPLAPPPIASVDAGGPPPLPPLDAPAAPAMAAPALPPLTGAPPPLPPVDAAPPPLAALPPAAAPPAPLPQGPGGSEITFQDGARYVGDVQNGQPNGQGEMTYADGSRYTGQFRDGLRDGQGQMSLTDGLVYEGAFVRDSIDGQGRLAWPDGAVYTGDFVAGKRTGQGVYQWPSGSQYQGRFDDGVIVGPGVFTSADGERYEGDFQNGRRTGQGVLTLPTGERYQGAMADGQPNGRGVYEWPNGQRYEGEFREGRIEGQGTMTYADGQTRTGLWANGQPAG
jgi:hypothetical protein